MEFYIATKKVGSDGTLKIDQIEEVNIVSILNYSNTTSYTLTNSTGTFTVPVDISVENNDDNFSDTPISISEKIIKLSGWDGTDTYGNNLNRLKQTFYCYADMRGKTELPFRIEYSYESSYTPYMRFVSDNYYGPYICLGYYANGTNKIYLGTIFDSDSFETIITSCSNYIDNILTGWPSTTHFVGALPFFTLGLSSDDDNKIFYSANGKWDHWYSKRPLKISNINDWVNMFSGADYRTLLLTPDDADEPVLNIGSFSGRRKVTSNLDSTKYDWVNLKEIYPGDILDYEKIAQVNGDYSVPKYTFGDWGLTPFKNTYVSGWSTIFYYIKNEDDTWTIAMEQKYRYSTDINLQQYLLLNDAYSDKNFDEWIDAMPESLTSISDVYKYFPFLLAEYRQITADVVTSIDGYIPTWASSGFPRSALYATSSYLVGGSDLAINTSANYDLDNILELTKRILKATKYYSIKGTNASEGGTGSGPVNTGGSSAGNGTNLIGGSGTWDDTSETIPVPLSHDQIIGKQGDLVEASFVTDTQLSTLSKAIGNASLFSDKTVLFNAISSIKVLFLPTTSQALEGDLHMITLAGETMKDPDGVYAYGNYLNNQYITVNFGYIVLSEYYGNFLDYGDYTKINLFLPFCGSVDLSADLYNGKTLSLYAVIDIINGTIVYHILSDGNDLMQVTGNCGLNIPLTADSNSALMSASIQLVASGIGLVAAVAAPEVSIPAIAAAGASTAFTGLNLTRKTKTSMISGGLDPNSGALSVLYPYIMIKRPVVSIPDSYGHYYGYPCNRTYKLSELSGFTKVSEIVLDGLNLTDAEKEDLMNMLKEGVYL